MNLNIGGNTAVEKHNTKPKYNMAISLQSISVGAQLKAPRMIILGPEKIGKSTFGAGAEGAIFLPIRQEEGIDSIECAKFPTLNTFAEVMEALTALATGEHEHKTVVIDSASALEPLIYQDVCEEHNWKSIEQPGYGKGYKEALSRWRKLMQALDWLRENKSMACVLIGHVAVTRFDDPLGPSYDKYDFDLYKEARAALFRWADFIGFCNTKTFVKKEDVGFNSEKGKALDAGQGGRFLFCQKSPAFPAGGRGPYGNLPPELPLSWDAFKSAVASVSA